MRRNFADFSLVGPRSLRRGALLALLGLALAVPTRAANRTWVGMNNDWDASTGNWNPADEPDADDAAIFNGNVSVDLANANESINGLTMSGGADLDLNGNDLTVNGLVQLTGAGTFLVVGPINSALAADAVTVNSGATLAIRGGALTINEESGSGLVDINAGGTLNGNGSIFFGDSVAAGTTLLINDGTLNAAFASQPDFGGLGAGTLSIGAADVDAQVDLDGIGENGSVSISRNDTLDIDAAISDGFDGTMVLSAGATLDIAVQWSLEGVINVNTVGLVSGTAGPEATITGNGFSLFGGVINLDPIDTLRLASRLHVTNGDIINHGKVIFDAEAAFASDVLGLTGTSQVEINALVTTSHTNWNGVLTIGEDGTLDVTQEWVNDEGEVLLEGGELRGSRIRNQNIDGIRGHGMISANVNNDTAIIAENGGTLVVGTGGGNGTLWDGGTTGKLEARTANLELRDDAEYLFHGDVSALTGQEVFLNGFALSFRPGSSLSLFDGRFRATHNVSFGADLTASGDSTIQVDGTMNFEFNSTAALFGELTLDNDFTIVSSGAEFTGTGALVNALGRTLTLANGITSADLAVRVVNNGILTLGGQIQGATFEQTATGTWQIRMGGAGAASFDRMGFTGAAVLDGTLELSLTSGYAPALGQMLNILSATGGVTGTFDSVLQPAMMPAGLMFNVNYLGSIVQLEVASVPTFAADFDLDGDVDADDLIAWHGAFGPGNGADADDDGDSDGADFLAWQQQLGSGVAADAAQAAVPEPASGPLMLSALLALASFGRTSTGVGRWMIGGVCRRG